MRADNPKLPLFVAATASIAFGIAFALVEKQAPAYTRSLEVMLLPLMTSCALWWYLLWSKAALVSPPRMLVIFAIGFPYVCLLIYLWRNHAPGTRVSMFFKFLGFFASAAVLMVAATAVTYLFLNQQTAQAMTLAVRLDQPASGTLRHSDADIRTTGAR